MDYLNDLIGRYPSLASCRDDIKNAFECLVETYRQGGKLLVAGNGGSAADAEHIVGELMKSVNKPRPVDAVYAESLKSVDPEMGEALAETLQGALPAIALSSHPSLNTAFANDCDPEMIFAQQVYGYGRKGDVLLAISTSGGSRNVLYAAVAAKAKGLKVIALTGRSGGRLASLSDISIKVPETETYKVQEFHLPVYHCLCLMLEDILFDKN